MSTTTAYKRINKHKPFLDLLHSSEKNQQKALLKTASTEQIRILSEIVLNILAGNIPLSSKFKSNLSRYKDRLRDLTDKNSSDETLKKKWNKFPVEILEIIIKIAFKFLKNLI